MFGIRNLPLPHMSSMLNFEEWCNIVSLLKLLIPMKRLLNSMKWMNLRIHILRTDMIGWNCWVRLLEVVDVDSYQIVIKIDSRTLHLSAACGLHVGAFVHRWQLQLHNCPPALPSQQSLSTVFSSAAFCKASPLICCTPSHYIRMSRVSLTVRKQVWPGHLGLQLNWKRLLCFLMQRLSLIDIVKRNDWVTTCDQCRPHLAFVNLWTWQPCLHFSVHRNLCSEELHKETRHKASIPVYPHPPDGLQYLLQN